MAKKVNVGNAVVNAVEQAAGMYGVPCYRINSTAFQAMAGGKMRPVFSAHWIDRFGERHTSGMADILLTPKIRISIPKGLVHIPINTNPVAVPECAEVCVALWIECKYGEGRLSKDQKLFRDDVKARGAYWMEARDSANDVLDWFERMEVVRT